MVGGAIVTTPNKQVMDAIGKTYAGRASSSAIMDLCITLLSMGLSGYKRILDTRQQLVSQFTIKFHEVATKYGGRLLSCPNNTISFAITLDHLISSDPLSKFSKLDLSIDQGSDGDPIINTQDHGSSEDNQQSNSKAISYFGSMLFTRCVSGTRVIPVHETKEVCGRQFNGYGSSTDNYPHSYMTAACAIGLTQSELEEFFIRLDKCFHDYYISKAKTKSRVLLK